MPRLFLVSVTEANSCVLHAGNRGPNPTPATSGSQSQRLPQEAEAHRPAQEGGQKLALGVCWHLSWVNGSCLDHWDTSWQMSGSMPVAQHIEGTWHGSCWQSRLHHTPPVVFRQVCRRPCPGGMRRLLLAAVQAAAREPVSSGPAIPTAFRKRPQTPEERALVSTSSELGLCWFKHAGPISLRDWPGTTTCASPLVGRPGSSIIATDSQPGPFLFGRMLPVLRHSCARLGRSRLPLPICNLVSGLFTLVYTSQIWRRAIPFSHLC